MWRSRSNSNLLIHNSPSNFSFSSFKDIQSLCYDDNNPQTHTPTPPHPISTLNPNPHPHARPSRSPSPSPSPHTRPSRSPSPSPNRNPSVFHRIRLASSVARAFSNPPPLPDPKPVLGSGLMTRPEPEAEAEPEIPAKSIASPAISETPVRQPEPKISIPGAEKRVVVYLTSLRVVRSTFEDCRAVKSILQGFRVTVDERDLSMDSSFLSELQRILGHYSKTKLTLPRVFIGGRYIGGADEVIELHETGELKKIVKGLPAAAPGVCEVCGGYRFILCDECDGSHKCFMESGGFRSCTSCNENGLIRCPSCASEPLEV